MTWITFGAVRIISQLICPKLHKLLNYSIRQELFSKDACSKSGKSTVWLRRRCVLSPAYEILPSVTKEWHITSEDPPLNSKESLIVGLSGIPVNVQTGQPSSWASAVQNLWAHPQAGHFRHQPICFPSRSIGRTFAIPQIYNNIPSSKLLGSPGDFFGRERAWVFQRSQLEPDFWLKESFLFSRMFWPGRRSLVCISGLPWQPAGGGLVRGYGVNSWIVMCYGANGVVLPRSVRVYSINDGISQL